MAHSDDFRRGTGLLIIEVVNSNPNGDPDNESDPRTRLGDIGEISPVSVKRKLRDLVDDKTGPVWKSIVATVKPTPETENFEILESRGRKRDELAKLAKVRNGEAFMERFWDARVFGSTFLEKGRDEGYLRTGTVQFGMGISIAPVAIQRLTLTNKAGVQEGKDRGMAPQAYRIVQHGVYCMPFFVNPSMASKSGCTARDIEVLKFVLPHAFAQTASFPRPDVRMRHAWYAEHKSALGSCPDHVILESLTPKKKTALDTPSSSWSEYEDASSLPAELGARLAACHDLVAT